MNTTLGSDGSQQDLRHTTTYRLARDPLMPITDSMTLGRGCLSTTQRTSLPPLSTSLKASLASTITRPRSRQSPRRCATGWKARTCCLAGDIHDHQHHHEIDFERHLEAMVCSHQNHYALSREYSDVGQRRLEARRGSSKPLAQMMREATVELDEVLDSLIYLIQQVRETREPIRGVHECFAQSFSDVQAALIRRETLERMTREINYGIGGSCPQAEP